VTYSQKMVHNLSVDFHVINLPVLILIFYALTAVGSTLSLGISSYEFKKGRTKGYTLMLLSIMVMLSSYSGSSLVNLISPHLWKSIEYPNFINVVVYFGEWVFVVMGVCYAILTVCFRFSRKNT
jgi:hypothetical protein